jgi:hypothetical protein
VTGTGTATGVRNAGTEPASALQFLVFSPIEEVEMDAPANVTPVDQMTGIDIQLLGLARGSLPEGAGTFMIERVIWQGGAVVPLDRAVGVEVGNVEEGGATLALESGDAIIWPSTSTSGPEELTAGERRLLAEGDGFGIVTGAIGAWTVAGDQPATVLRAIVVPAERGTPSA